MKTETKVIAGIFALTALIIIGGVFLFQSRFEPQGPKDYSKYIQTGLDLDKTKVTRAENPKITGATSTTQLASSSKITVTEFLDYECPACATNGEIITRSLLNMYGSNITIVRKIFPVHGQSSIDLARFVLASQILGGEAYQNIHTKVFSTFDEWIILGKKDREDYLKKLITDLGYDYEVILKESQNEKYLNQITTDKQDAIDLGISATPSFIIENHTRITGGLPLEEFSKYIAK